MANSRKNRFHLESVLLTSSPFQSCHSRQRFFGLRKLFLLTYESTIAFLRFSGGENSDVSCDRVVRRVPIDTQGQPDRAIPW